jgi:hypothetical protein
MARGLALAIGLNSVDPVHYQGWSGDLEACEADAKDMAAIATSRKFEVTTLLTSQATRSNVLNTMAAAAEQLSAGDVFMFSCSSHGGQLPDLNGDEPDQMDETICLFDGELVDDETYLALAKFRVGVRVIVFSDSCHSGSMVKVALVATDQPTTASRVGRVLGSDFTRYRAMPHPVALRTYEANRAFYDKILTNPDLLNSEEKVTASVLLISGCQDNQLSSDGTFNGLFTGTLRRVWNGGTFKGNYREFHQAIVTRMPPEQTPNYFIIGTPNSAFEKETPFSIEGIAAESSRGKGRARRSVL